MSIATMLDRAPREAVQSLAAERMGEAAVFVAIAAELREAGQLEASAIWLERAVAAGEAAIRFRATVSALIR